MDDILKKTKNVPLTKNPLYNLKSKRKMKNLLFIDNEHSIINSYYIYIKNRRIIEQPKSALKLVQQRIFYFLKMINVPEYVFSSKQGASNIDNAKYHQNYNYIVTVDIAKFFPKCTFQYVFKFFNESLKLSQDNSQLLSEVLTIDYETLNIGDDIIDWIISTNNSLKYDISLQHIPTGGSASQLLSFLAYSEMFEKINRLSKVNRINMSLFVDDLTFSSNNRISKTFIKQVEFILSTYGHEINREKIRYFSEKSAKKVTGVYISSNKELSAPSRLHMEVSTMYNDFIRGNKVDISVLRGKANYVKRIEKGTFRELIKSLKSR